VISGLSAFRRSIGLSQLRRAAVVHWRRSARDLVEEDSEGRAEGLQLHLVGGADDFDVLGSGA